MTIGECAVCGLEGPVEPFLAHWVKTDLYEFVERCADHAACRNRVDISGAPWPLTDPKVQRVGNGKRDPHEPMTDWSAHVRQARATEPPGMTDYRPPVDDGSGRFTFSEPTAIPVIPVVRRLDELDW